MVIQLWSENNCSLIFLICFDRNSAGVIVNNAGLMEYNQAAKQLVVNFRNMVINIPFWLNLLSKGLRSNWTNEVEFV